MGYTHYWNRKGDFTTEQWNKIREDFLTVSKHCDRNKIPLAEEYDVPMPSRPVCNSTTIKFNGCREDGHETFFMTRKKPEPQPWESAGSFDFCKTARKPYDPCVLSCREDGHETFFMTRKKPEPQPWESAGSFDFCKTARKPYDLAVCLTLLVCVHHAPDSIKVGSDGDWDGDWLESRQAFKTIFGVEAECPFEEATT